MSALSPEELRRLKMATEKEVRAIIERDFSASRMSATKWQETLEALSGLQVRYRIKFVDVGHPLEGSLYPATDKYFDSWWGPVLILSVEWLEINPIQEVTYGLLLKPELIDQTAEVERRLQEVGVPYEHDGPCLRIIAHVRNAGMTQAEQKDSTLSQ